MWAAALAWLAQNGVQLAISIALTLLQKSGLLTKFEADGIKAGTHVLQVVNNLKADPQYPTGPNGAGTANTNSPKVYNFTSGQDLEAKP